MSPILGLVLHPAALAQQPARPDPVESWGDIRTIGSSLTDFPIDADGATHEQLLWLDQRVRLGLGLTGGIGRAVTEWDLLTGQLAGDTWSVARDVDARNRGELDALTLAGVTPRALYGETLVGRFQLQAGLVLSHWGLGMLANDGAHDPLFGRTDLGDRVIRARITRLPQGGARTSMFVTGAVDYVVDDDFAALSDQQTAMQGILSLLWVRPASGGGEPARYGVYAVVRDQWEAPLFRDPPDVGEVLRSTAVFALDGTAEVPWTLDGGWGLRGAVETAVLAGMTNRSTSYTARERLGVLSLGLAAQAVLAEPTNKARMYLRAGYASGDADPDDGVTYDFTFDRNFGVGMVLFDQVLGTVEAAAHAQLTDPENSGQPPDGVEAIVTEGSFRRAVFLQPAVQLYPLPWAEVRAGVVVAFGTVPYAQPFYSFRAGGVPTNPYDLPSEGRLLGTELDWALAAHRAPSDETWWRPSLEIQGGHLLLGSPLKGSGPGVIHHLMGVARFQW